jgi:hypothetical protein
MNRARYALAAKHRSDTFRIRRREDNFMGVFNNIRHGAAVTVCVVAMSIGSAAAAQASTAHAAPAANPAYQTGVVHSCTTNRDGSVYTTDGGYTWDFDGSGGAGTQYQDGVVYSYTTHGHANVVTEDGGLAWIYDADSGGPFCSIP